MEACFRERAGQNVEFPEIWKVNLFSFKIIFNQWNLRKNMKIWNLTKSQKVLNGTNSGFGDITRSTAPKNLLKPLFDLKIVPNCSRWSMVNLLVYGQLFSALNCPIAMLLDFQWDPPSPTFDVAKKAQPF